MIKLDHWRYGVIQENCSLGDDTFLNISELVRWLEERIETIKDAQYRVNAAREIIVTAGDALNVYVHEPHFRMPTPPFRLTVISGALIDSVTREPARLEKSMHIVVTADQIEIWTTNEWPDFLVVIKEDDDG